MTEREEESIEVALGNARANYQKLIVQLPRPIELKEKRLLRKVRKQRGGALKKLKYLYREIDSIFAFVSRFTACKRFCSHCCHIPVREVVPHFRTRYR